jgi:S1-C subfamily serine protease
MVLRSIGRAGALAVAGVLIALTTTCTWGRGSTTPAATGRRPPGSGSRTTSSSARSLRVTAVEPGTPAEAAGLRVGDEIVALNGRPLTTERPLHDEILHVAPGRTSGSPSGERTAARAS